MTSYNKSKICDECEGEDDYHSENCSILKKLIEEWQMK